MMGPTDGAEVVKVASAYGAELLIIRPPELDNQHTPIMPVISHAVKSCCALGWNVENLCCVYPGVLCSWRLIG